VLCCVCECVDVLMAVNDSDDSDDCVDGGVMC
jgi:hypothetical protein